MRLIIALVILAMVLVATGYVAYNKLDALSSPALKLFVSANMANGTLEVTNITFEQTTVPVIYKKGNSIVAFPDISVSAKNLKSEPISYWAAESWDKDESESIYELTVVFIEGKEPMINDSLLLPVRLTNYNGEIIYKTTAFYDWR